MTATDRDDPAKGTQARDAPRVFVSHASADAETALRFVTALELHGIRCWLAPRDVVAGSQYADAIVRAISDAPVFLVLLSARATTSAHVGREVERAGSKGRRILALRLDSAPLTPALEYFLGESQWVDLKDGEAAAQSRLVQAIQQSAGPASTIATPVPVARPAQSKRLQVAVIAGVMLGVAGALAWKYLPPSGVPGQTSATAPTAVSVEKTIAVLPFTDMSEKKDQEYFADGLADELLNVLAKVPGLRVIGRTSSFQFKGKADDLRSIGTRLHAAHVVEGSVRRVGNQVRITAQLIRTTDGVHEWSETYDRDIKDILRLQGDIALSIGRALELSVSELLFSSSGQTRSPEAYDLYLRSLHAFDRATVDGYQDAQAELVRAIALDPQFLRAREMLGLTHQILAANAWVPLEAGWEQVRRDAMDLLTRDPSNGIAHLLLARLHTLYSWNWVEAQREIDKAMEAGDRGWAALYSAGNLAMAVGQLDKAAQFMRAALAADPLSADAHCDLSAILIAMDRLTDAEAEVNQCLAIAPNYEGGYQTLGDLRLKQGRSAQALEFFTRETSPGLRMTSTPLALYALGRRSEAEAVLQQAISAHSTDQPFGIAIAYAHFGNADKTFEWLDRALAQKSPFLMYFGVSAADFRKVSQDPRYTAFLRKMNLPVGGTP